MKKTALILGLVLSLFASAGASAAGSAGGSNDSSEHSGWSLFDARLIPVQSGGRVKPMDSFARETVLFETGSRSYQGWDPVDLLFSWIAFPQVWEKERFIQVGRIDVRRQLGLDEQRTKFSPEELFRNPSLLQYAERMQRGDEGTKPPSMQGKSKTDQREEELKRVFDRLGLFRNVVAGTAWLVIPKSGGAQWDSLAGSEGQSTPGDMMGNAIRGSFSQMLHAFQSGDQARFQETAKQTRLTIENAIPNWTKPQARAVGVELLYNISHPFQFAWIFYLVAGLFWLLSFRVSKLKIVGAVFTGLAFLMHAYGFGLRCYVAGRPPVTNMYESIIWVMLGVVVFAAILYRSQKQAITFVVASFLATIGLIAADAAPAMMDPGIHPLVPVLRSNYWLTIHVLTITLGYAALALTFGLGLVTLFQYLKKKSGYMRKVEDLNQLTYRAMQIGVVLLAAGTILGGVWADYSWGRFWGWDPKETWALIALLCYVAILHGRFTNWVGQFAFAAWTVVGFLSVLMAWYGVNFILGVGLHSYGFSSGGFTTVATFTSIVLAYVITVAVLHKGSERKAVAVSPEKAPAR